MQIKAAAKEKKSTSTATKMLHFTIYIKDAIILFSVLGNFVIETVKSKSFLSTALVV